MNLPDIKHVCRYYAYKFGIEYQDLVQDVCLKLLTKGDKYVETGSSYRTYISRVVNNMCIDRSRLKANQQRFVGMEWIKHTVHGDCTRHDIAQTIMFVRRRWPNKARQNSRIVWMLAQGYTYDEIGSETGMQLASLKTRIFRIRKHL